MERQVRKCHHYVLLVAVQRSKCVMSATEWDTHIDIIKFVQMER